jgi:hypothetical protein
MDRSLTIFARIEDSIKTKYFIEPRNSPPEGSILLRELSDLEKAWYTITKEEEELMEKARIYTGDLFTSLEKNGDTHKICQEASPFHAHKVRTPYQEAVRLCGYLKNRSISPYDDYYMPTIGHEDALIALQEAAEETYRQEKQFNTILRMLLCGIQSEDVHPTANLVFCIGYKLYQKK